MDERQRTATEFARPDGDARLSADAAAGIVASIDLDVTRTSIARIAVEAGCDCSALYEADAAGEVRRVALAARDARHDPLLQMLRGPRVDRDSARVIRRALLAGEPKWIAALGSGDVDDEIAASWDHPLFRSLPVRSAILAPVGAPGAQVAIGLYLARPDRAWDETDVEHARDLAAWSAIALEHAHAHHAVLRAHTRLERLVSVLSHDLGNPLTALRIAVSMMIRGQADGRTEEQPQYLEHMSASIDQLKRLIEEVRDMRRLEADSISLLLENDAPTMLVGHIIEQSAAHAQSRSIRVLTRTHGEMPLVRVDRRRTVQALNVLVERAIAVTATGGSVAITMESDADDVIVSVSDEGAAPSPADLEGMFDQFWTDPLERGGHETALRLALARGIIANQGGRIWAAARDPAGLTVCCALPHAPRDDLRTPE